MCLKHFSSPVAESSTSPGKHTDPVWQVKWVNKGTERGETLVSISTDGRLVEWSMKKGLSFSPLMVLKRIGNTEGVISRQASGLSFDFPSGDSATYFAGTEDGLIHKCSVSYNEQYLETYSGHFGPVYRIRCSPFWDRLFLSCSADWTVRLWEQRQTTPLHTLRSVDLSDVVNDVAWSPTCSTVFASVAGDGRVELWDLRRSTLDPVVSLNMNKLERASQDSNGVEGNQARDNRTTTGENMSPKSGLETHSDAGGTSSSKAGGPRATVGGRPAAPAASSPASVVGSVMGGESSNLKAGVETIQLTAVTLAANAPVLAVGGSDGAVDVYKIVGIDVNPGISHKEQVERLQAAVLGTNHNTANG
ncbi:unnamed protein product [Discosporangium mesarthrocarpum]